jgi:hypothetical protein
MIHIALKFAYIALKFALEFAFSVIVFACWIEYRVGNILYRCDETGKNRIQITPIIGYFRIPLYDGNLWHYSLWDLNPYIILPVFRICYNILTFVIL